MSSKYIIISIVFFIASLLFQPVFAFQKVSNSLKGTITSADNNQPLAGATVTISDLKLNVITDENGRYEFANLPAGNFLIHVSHVGYRSRVEYVAVKNITEKNFTLSFSVVENEKVTVTGVSSATQLKRTPVQVSVISKKDIEQATGNNILDIVAKEPGVSIVTTGPAIAKPFIRGVGYNRVVTVNDGIRQEGQQWGDEHGLEVDEYSAQKIEVLKGPASLMYGSDAIGGVINILTNIPVANNTIRASLMSAFNGNNRMYGENANFGGNINGFNWNVYGSIKNAADYKNKYDGSVLNSRFNENNFGGYIGLNKNWGYTHLIFSRFNQNIGMIEGERDDVGNFILDGYNLTDQLKNSRKPLVPGQKVNHTKIASDNSISFNNGGRLALLIGYQQNRRKEFGNPNSPQEAEAYFYLQTLNYNAAYHLPVINNWKTTFGINGMSQQNTNKAEEAIIPDYNLFDFGVYGYISKLYNKTTVSAGARFDNRNLSGKQMFEDEEVKFEPFNRRFSNVAASLGLTHELSEHVSIKANISRGYRAPNASELAANGEHEGTNRYEIGNKNLKSEVSFAADAGLEIFTNHFDFNLSPFYNNISNYIFYRKLLNTAGGDSLINGNTTFEFTQQNARLTGVEASVDIHPHPLDWLHFENTFSWVRGKFTQPVDGSPNLPLIAPARVLTELRAEFPNANQVLQNVYCKIEMDNVAAQNKFFAGYNTETATKGYSLFNAAVGTDIAIAGKKAFSIHLGINNITDAGYQSHLSRLKYTAINPVTQRVGVFNMGRNFSARIIVPFIWQIKP